MGAYDHQGCEHHFRSLLWDDPSRSVIENMIRWISTIEIVLATKDLKKKQWQALADADSTKIDIDYDMIGW